MTHPDPEIRAQFEKDRRLSQARYGVNTVSWFSKLHPTWQALFVIGTAFIAGGGIATAIAQYRGIPNIAARNSKMLDSLVVHERVIQRMQDNEAVDMRQNGDIRELRIKLDSIGTRQQFTLAILCELDESASVRRLCALSGYQVR